MTLPGNRIDHHDRKLPDSVPEDFFLFFHSPCPIYAPLFLLIHLKTPGSMLRCSIVCNSNPFAFLINKSWIHALRLTVYLSTASTSKMAP